MVRKFQNIANCYAKPSYFHNIESTLYICVHVCYITLVNDGRPREGATPARHPEVGGAVYVRGGVTFINGFPSGVKTTHGVVLVHVNSKVKKKF